MARHPKRTASDSEKTHTPAPPERTCAPEAAVQCYHAANSNRAIKTEAGMVRFKDYGFLGGSWSGVYVTLVPGEISSLDKLAQDPRSGITKIDVAEYNKCLKQLAVMHHGSFEFSHLPQPIDVASGPVDASMPPATLTGELPDPEPVVTVAPVETTDAALTIGPVTQTAKN